MLYHKVLITICSIIFYNVILAKPAIKDCDFLCEDDDTKPICVLDKNEVCFRKLSSKCVMKRIECILEKDYLIYVDAYCEFDNFLCQPKFQSPPIYTDLTHSYTYGRIPQGSTEAIFKTESGNIDKDN